MASLFVKDAEVNALAERFARLRGLTKTAAVKLALRNELERAGQATPLRERMAAWRKSHPLGRPTGLLADKAFYDSLNDEDGD